MRWLYTIRNFFEHRAVVLMYHRIADVEIDPWNLAVSPANFDEQIRLLTSKYTVVPVATLIRNLQQKKMEANAVCITFDDGYADNFLSAKPVLEKYNCPATFFIPSQFIGKRQPFWWDELQALFLETQQLPDLFQRSISDELIEFDLGADAILSTEHIKNTGKWQQLILTRRYELFMKIWGILQPLPYADIEAALVELRSWAASMPSFPTESLPMTHTQLKELSQHPLFSIGLHTVTHPALAYHPEETQYHEVADNKKALQQYEPLNAIAFPYGNYNNSTVAVLNRQRLEAGFTTEEKKCTLHTNPYCIGRFQVTNQDGSGFEKQLRQWLNA